MASSPIAILGAGSWGTALAILLATNGELVHLWDHDSQQIAALKRDRRNNRYLPDFPLSEKIIPIENLSQAISEIEDILICVPSHAFRPILMQCKQFFSENVRIAWGTKGIDPESGKLLHEVVVEILQRSVAIALLAGPSFAKEVAMNLPTAITLAHNDLNFANSLVKRLHNPHFRVYTTEDIIGAQICGAVKNVLAIAVGISDGLQLGANARSALITRGLAEMTRLGVALGGKPETFMGLAGVGDLVLTTTDDQSRNRRFGLALGSGKDIDAVAQEIGQIVEGVSNARQVYQLAKEARVEMPITEQVYRIVHEKIKPADAVAALLSRELKEEGI